MAIFLVANAGLPFPLGVQQIVNLKVRVHLASEDKFITFQTVTQVAQVGLIAMLLDGTSDLVNQLAASNFVTLSVQ
jgi:hypothetical protein